MNLGRLPSELGDCKECFIIIKTNQQTAKRFNGLPHLKEEKV